MNKLLGLLIVTVFSSSAVAQGTVKFANSSTTLISYGGWGGPVVPLPPYPGSVFYFALLTAPVGTTDPGQFVFSGRYATNTTATTGGRIQGGSLFGVACQNWPVWEERNFIVVGWSADNGTTFNPAWLTSGPMQGAWGISSIGTGRAGGTDPATGLTYPPLVLFSANGISAGFWLESGWWPPLAQLWISPSAQTVMAGATVVFSAQGTAFSAYQWGFNGANISGATNSSLLLTNVQPGQAGTYSVTGWGCVCGGGGPLTSYATLVVVSPPSVVVAPNAQTLTAGGSCVLVADATGTPPLYYQWSFWGTNLTSLATTNRVLRINHAQASQSGTYYAVVSNVAGIVSAPAEVSVISSVPHRLAPALVVGGVPGQTVYLDYSQELWPGPSWSELGNVLLTNTSQLLVDTSEPVPGQRFYRARLPQLSGNVPELDIFTVPAVTLSGPAGTGIRLDYINQFGPVDAWVSLTTVTLTNGPQFYFDTTAIGQSPRLYRLVPQP